MAFYTGNVSNFTELRNALVDSCVIEGWTWADGILSKGAIFVRPFAREAYDPTGGNRFGAGLVIEGGTGKSGSSLVNPSSVKPRLGSSGLDTNFAPSVVWPAQYNIHIFDTEVFIILKFNVQYYYRLAFGISNIQGSGLWLSGYAPEWTEISAGQQYNGFDMTHNSGASGGIGRVTAPFWRSGRSTAAYANADSVLFQDTWQGNSTNQDNEGYIFANNAIDPLFSLKNQWNSEAIFLPFQCYLRRASGKISLLLDLDYARLLRIDNFEPEQIITLGSVKWKVYPFLRKNIQAADTGSGTHSGTFGWAIRYDGP